MAAPTYTFTKKVAPNEPNALSYYGGQLADGNHEPISQAAAGIQTSDNTATPVVSPVAFPTTVTTLNTPLNAISITIVALANSLNVSEADPTVTTNYFTIPVGVPTTIGLTRQGVLYIKANTGAATGSSFYYAVL